MNITLLSVDIKTNPTKNGKSYQSADVAYKNNSFQGKIEGKKIMSFGATKPAFDVVATASPGQTFEVEIIKNAAGYNDWVSMTPATAGAASPVATPQAGVVGKAPATSPRSTYETPEERAQRQVLIVRQSSLSSAATVLTAGAKTPPSAQAVVDLAKVFEAYVFGTEVSTDDGSIDAMQSDEFPDVN